MPEISSDDDLYRVNGVWLGPPSATMPFRARYVAWGVGIILLLATFALARIWFPFGFFTLAWSVVIAITLTRLICSKIEHDRPLSAVLTMFIREITTPRRKHGYISGAAATTRVRVTGHRARPAAPEGQQLTGPTDVHQTASREDPRV